MRLPFEGLTKLQISKLFVLLGVHRYRYTKGEEIVPTIKNDNIIAINYFLVKKGLALYEIS